AGFGRGLGQLGGSIGRIGWGVVSDRLGRRAPVMVLNGGLAVLVCLGAAWLVRPGVPAGVLGGLFLLVGLSTMGWNALYITLAAEVTRHRAAAVVGARAMGNLAGMPATTPGVRGVRDP